MNPFIIIIVLQSLFSTPAPEQKAIDYFVNTTPTCQSATECKHTTGSGETSTTSSIENKGAYITLWKQTLQCNGKDTELIFSRNGQNKFPWATNSWYLDSRGILILDEVSMKEEDGSIYSRRLFRETVSQLWGLLSVPAALPSGGLSVTWGKGDEEHRDFNCGNTVIWTDHIDGNWSEFFFDFNSYFVLDCRPFQDCKTKHYVQALIKIDHWGDNKELYAYGKWTDPITGKEEGLGLIRWYASGSAFPTSPNSEIPLLVETPPNNYTPCYTCPSPNQSKEPIHFRW